MTAAIGRGGELSGYLFNPDQMWNCNLVGDKYFMKIHNSSWPVKSLADNPARLLSPSQKSYWKISHV
jgi:hypothetical protein